MRGRRLRFCTTCMGVGGMQWNIAWLHASIADQAAHHVAAEIEYPLMTGWFREEGYPHLTKALNNILS